MRCLSSKMRSSLFATSIIHLALSLGAAELTITPQVITNNYIGPITMTVSDLSPGQTVRLRKFLDVNRNGTVDSEDILVENVFLTDGQVETIHGHRNWNVPGDEDGSTNGKIRTFLQRDEGSWHNRIAGRFIYQLTDLQRRFGPLAASLVIKPQIQPQGVQGRIIDINGSPVPNALLLCDSYPHGVLGTVTDANGNYRFYTEPGDFRPLTIVQDKTLPRQDPAVKPNQFTELNLTAKPAANFISGRVVDATSTNGLAGVFVGLNYYYLQGAFTGSDGSFRIPMDKPEDWISFQLDGSLAHAGYVSTNSYFESPTSGRMLTVPVKKANALIFGAIKDDAGRPVENVSVIAGEQNSFNYIPGRSVANGDFSLGVSPGSWQLFVSSVVKRGYWPPEYDWQSYSTVTEGAFEMNVTLTRINARLKGRVVDETGAIYTNIPIRISSARGDDYGQTDENGRFDFGVVGGTWTLDLYSYDYQETKKFLSGPVSYHVSNGQTLDVVYPVRRVTSRIVGSIKTPEGVPITDASFQATTTNNGVAYSVYTSPATNGYFSLGVFEGNWDLHCYYYSSSNYVKRDSINVNVSGSTSVEFVTRPYVHLRGKMKANINGVLTVLTNREFSVSYLENSDQNSPWYLSFFYGKTDNNGRFDVAYRPGEWKIELESAPTIGLFAFETNFTVLANISNVVVTVPLATNFITGHVRDSDGNPVSGVVVSASLSYYEDPVNWRNYHYFSADAKTDTNGFYRLNVFSIDWTNWNVQISCENLYSIGLACVPSQSVNVTNAENVADFTVVILTNHLRGRLVDETGAPIPNISLTLQKNSAYNFYTHITTDTNGNWDALINRGEWSISWYSWDAEPAKHFGTWTNVQVFANEDYPHEVVLMARRIAGYINGTVKDDRGNPFENRRIKAELQEIDLERYDFTDQNGRYSFPVANGQWEISCSCQNLESLRLLCPSNLTITISNNPVATNFVLQHPPPLRIVATPWPNAMVDWPYSHALESIGGEPPFVWYQTTDLPAGLTMDYSGHISGIPRTSGRFNLPFVVHDYFDYTNAKTFSFAVETNFCAYSVSTNFLLFSAAGGTNVLQLDCFDVCPWNVRWIWGSWGNVKPEFGTGPASISFALGQISSSAPQLNRVVIGNQVIDVLVEGVPVIDRLLNRSIIISSTNTGVSNPIVIRCIREPRGYIAGYELFVDGVLAQKDAISYFAPTSRFSTEATGRFWTNHTSHSMDLLFSFNSKLSGTVVNPGGVISNGFDFNNGQFVLGKNGPDFNHDGRTDLFWQRPDGAIVVWQMNNTSVITNQIIPRSALPNSITKVLGVADFDIDGNPDFVWQKADGTIGLSIMNGATSVDTRMIDSRRIAPGWSLAAFADLKEGTWLDFIWQHTDGRVAAWLMYYDYVEGSTLLRETPVSPGWHIVGSSDFNRDTRTDLLWQHNDGRLAVWLMIGPHIFRSFPLLNDSRTAIGLADLNQDGTEDILWMNTNQVVSVSYMNGTNVVGNAVLKNGTAVPVGWKFIGPK
jgi:hypothetical protein